MSTTYNITYYINLLLKKQNDISIDYIKSNKELIKNSNLFIINRFISFTNNITLANVFNRYIFNKNFSNNKEILLLLMYKLLPKNNNNSRINYYKYAQYNNKFNKEIISIFKKIYNCEYLSTKEVEEYIIILLKKQPEKLIITLFSNGIDINTLKKYFSDYVDNNIFKKLNKSKNKITNKEFKNIKKEVKDWK